MDKVTDSDSVDAGSIPARSTKLEVRVMDNERYTTFDYAKLFLLMIIPIYGFCFTCLLAFSKEVTGELKCFAKGALIARLVFLFGLAIIAIISVSYVLPYLSNLLNRFNVLRLFL